MKVKLNVLSDGKLSFKVFNNIFSKFINIVKDNGEIDFFWVYLKMMVELFMEMECLWDINKKCYCIFKVL